MTEPISLFTSNARTINIFIKKKKLILKMKCFKGIREDTSSNKCVPYFPYIGHPTWNNGINYKKMRTDYKDVLDVADRIIDMNSKEDKWQIACNSHIPIL